MHDLSVNHLNTNKKFVTKYNFKAKIKSWYILIVECFSLPWHATCFANARSSFVGVQRIYIWKFIKQNL